MSNNEGWEPCKSSALASLLKREKISQMLSGQFM